MNKIALVSDIHGNIPALEAVSADIEKKKIDIVFNLGDHLSGPLWPKETAEFLKKRNWIHILGNHDRMLYSKNPAELNLSDKYAYQLLDKDDFDWLRMLSPLKEFENEFLLFHGTPKDDTLYLLETVEQGRGRLAQGEEIKNKLGKINLKYAVCGHTHIPRVVETDEGTTIINPGSVGLQAYDDTMPEYHVMETGTPHARYAIIERREGKWSAEFILVDYNYEFAACQASKNGRADWETALRKGTMN